MPALICPECGNAFEILAKEIKRRTFCGHSCAARFRNRGRVVTVSTREKIGDTMRGRGEGKTYTKRLGRHEHRVVAEQKIGRSLLPGAIVHHRNELKRDNAPSNLDVLASQAEHARLHATGKKREPKTVCKFGHPLTDGNVTVTCQGKRRCLTCERKYQREWKRRHRSGVSP